MHSFLYIHTFDHLCTGSSSGRGRKKTGGKKRRAPRKPAASKEAGRWVTEHAGGSSTKVTSLASYIAPCAEASLSPSQVGAVP